MELKKAVENKQRNASATIKRFDEKTAERLNDHNRRKEIKIAEMEKEIYQTKQFRARELPRYIARERKKDEPVKLVNKTEGSAKAEVKTERKEVQKKEVEKKKESQAAKKQVEEEKQKQKEQKKIEDLKKVRARLNDFYSVRNE